MFFLFSKWLYLATCSQLAASTPGLVLCPSSKLPAPAHTCSHQGNSPAPGGSLSPGTRRDLTAEMGSHSLLAFPVGLISGPGILSLPPGPNLALYVPDGCPSPATFPRTTKQHTRMLAVGGLDLTNTLHTPSTSHLPPPSLPKLSLPGRRLSSASIAMATMWLSPSGKLVAKALVAKGYNSHPGVRRGGVRTQQRGGGWPRRLERKEAGGSREMVESR